MALPKKSGLRKIRVGAVDYYWAWRTDYGSKTIRVRVGEVQDQNKHVLIEAYHVDVWLTIGEPEPRPNEIQIITPSFIRQAVDFARSNGWDEAKNQRMHLVYHNQALSIKEKESLNLQSPSTNTTNPNAKTRSA